jgi:hypothetical protein
VTAPTVPSWLALPLAACLAAAAGFGLVGLALAVASLFYPVLVVPLGAAASVVLFRAAGLPSRVPTKLADRTAAIGATLIACASTIVNAALAGQHLLIDRDPGAYINTGRWLSTHHGLTFVARVGAFTTTSNLRYSSPAIYGHGPRMHFQFSHLLGVLLAEARWVGGDHAMFVLTPLLGGVAILAFYAFASSFVSPPAALVATTALTVSITQAHFSRDPYAEIVVELVLFGSVWLLTLPDLHVRRAIFAGILLGATVAARLDGPLYLVSIPVLIGITQARRGRDATDPGASGGDDLRRDTVAAFGWAAAGVTVLALLDVGLRVPEYARYVGLRVLAEYVGLVGATAGAIVLGRRAHRWHPRFARDGRTAVAAGTALSVVLFLMWFVRPYVQEMRGRLVTLVAQIQRADHLELDPGRHYFENSLRWLAWYLGPPALAAGIIGGGWLLHRTIRRGSMAAWVVMVSFCSVGAVYLWNASITPDQLWVMRRFVPIVIPGLILFAAVVIDAIARRFRRAGYVAAAALAALAIAWPVSADLPVWAETSQPNSLNAVKATCRALGPHAAVVVIGRNDSFHAVIPQTLRGFCNIPVALSRTIFAPDDYVRLARQWRAEGRVLSVIAGAPALITEILPSARPRVVAVAPNDHLLEQTLERPPRHYTSQSVSFVIATVPLSRP